MCWISRLALPTMLVSLCCVAGASAATLQPIGDFDQPIFVTSDPTNPADLFVVEREGRVVEDDGGSRSVFADLTDLVSCCESERGLLSIALAPDFATSGRFYAAYAGKPAAGGAEGDVHVDAFRHDSGALVREPLFSVGHATNANHNGGQLELGPDGNLYISIGDGGGGGDPFESGQDLDSLLGKILRLEPHPGAEAQIWSYGLRNPWRFSFDRLSGAMVIADVGQNAREEIDYVPSPAPGVVGGNGNNYGWNCREGFSAYPEPGASCAGASGFAEPVFDYPHADPGDGMAHGCSITGGYVARDSSLGDLYGRYVYADYCVGEIRSLVLPATGEGVAGEDRSEGLGVAHPVSFGEDSCGRLYVVSQVGTVYRFVGATPAACAATHAPSASPVATRAPKGKRARLHLTVRARPVQGALNCSSPHAWPPARTRQVRWFISIVVAAALPESASTATASLAFIAGSSTDPPSGRYCRAATTAARCGRSRWRSRGHSGRRPASSSARGDAWRR
ncbi:MAG TPA: PQQ-dependent sugar dehydrogenase [Solirubrobacterales bacterium]|nr:PQQ-dependent sugar dehydrogenase [Solirubrobacterales bacterium]